ncbi:nuclease-related domain-containing protein [Peribacillus sp. SCS-26]|uniref:nuclease-related domain-containing protein n=1 Tax=Paraperibacillus marinus TaxID=3115295 RepID=UPI0039061554
MENLKCECLLLNDLLLKQNNTVFQIDSLLITSESIYLFEIKNYEGDYYFESDRFYKKPKIEITSPLNQLNRSESLLRQLLQHLGFGCKIPLHASIVFINPAFTLYHSPLNAPFIFTSQIQSLITHLNKTPSRLTDRYTAIADKLISLHIQESPFKLLPPYEYEQLRKGIICRHCSSFSTYTKGHKCICGDCGHTEPAASSILRTIKEFQLLFPGQKITTNAMHEWCDIVESKKRIKRVLDKNFKIKGVHQWSYYE